MLELFAVNPWLAVIAMGCTVAIACTAIVIITDYLRRTHQSEIDAGLKHEMIARGMSAEDIKTVLEASGDPEAASLKMGNENVRVGLGKFHVEIGGNRQAGVRQPVNG